MRNAVKIAGAYERGAKPWELRQVLNHEIGHIYGLMHTWAYNDGCDDTPRNPRCWHRTDKPPCDTEASNNLMDYNAYQSAWSLCQIGKMQYNMANENHHSRNYLWPNWCKLHEDRHVFIQDSIHWMGAVDLEGHLTIRSGGTLKVDCRLSIPKDGKITVEPGGRLILDHAFLHNACEDTWQGIEVQTLGDQKGVVELLNEPKIEDIESPPISSTK